MSLLKTVRVVFFDPDNGEIYGTAVLGTAKAEGGEISAPLAMQDNKKIVSLNTAAEAKKVSVLIYLDGTGNTGMGANEATELKLYSDKPICKLQPHFDSENCLRRRDVDRHRNDACRKDGRGNRRSLYHFYVRVVFY